MAVPAQPQPDGIPDFIGVGVQKSGTTWLADILAQHPGILIRQKETEFFIRKYHKGEKWYQAHFHDKNGRVAGEITPFYLIDHPTGSWRKEFYPHINLRHETYFWRRTCPSVRDEIHSRYPDLRLFAIFRNPVDRAWSAYWHWRNRKERHHKTMTSFEKMWDADGRWLQTMGNYAHWLTFWKQKFPDMAIFFYDDIRQNPLALAQEVYRFVGADPSFTPDTSRRINDGSYPPVPDALRTRISAAYQKQIQDFARLVGRDLSHWLA